MGWLNDIVGGTILRIPKIQSPGYVAGSTGWSINQDGSAEFNNLSIRGTFNGTDFVINSSGAFFYSGTPANGNLIVSIAPGGGTDAYGNQYPQGIGAFGSLGTITAIGLLNDKFISIQCDTTSQTITFSPDLAVWNSGSLRSVSGNGKITITAPQLIADTGNGAVVTLSPASPAGAGNASIDLQADKITITTGTPGTPVWTASGGSIKNSISTNGNGIYVGSSPDLVAVFAASRANATDDVFSARIDGDTNSRWVAEANGKQLFGPGGGTSVDTALYRDAAGSLTVKAQLNTEVGGTPESWHAVTFANSWANQAGRVNCQYRKIASPPNSVEIIGWISHASISGSSAINTAVPSAYRPASEQTISVDVIAATNAYASSTEASCLDIGTAGVFTLSALPAGTTQVSFHGTYSLDA